MCWISLASRLNLLAFVTCVLLKFKKGNKYIHLSWISHICILNFKTLSNKHKQRWESYFITISRKWNLQIYKIQHNTSCYSQETCRVHKLMCDYRQNCLNGHLFQHVTCPYGQLSVTPLPFYYSFDSCIKVSSQRGHGQAFCTAKRRLTAKEMLTDGQFNHLQERLRSLFIALSSYVLRIYQQTIPRHYVDKSETILFSDGPIC